jgi:hypothetical protein
LGLFLSKGRFFLSAHFSGNIKHAEIMVKTGRRGPTLWLFNLKFGLKSNFNEAKMARFPHPHPRLKD